MSNKTDGSQKITPASHGDELDVLEAIYRISKEKKIDILNEKQLNVLKNSGRVSDGNDIQTDDLSMRFTEGVERVAIKDFYNEIIAAFEQVMIDDFGEEKWRSFSEREKMLSARSYFYLVYGFSLDKFVKNAYSLIGGSNND